MEARLSSSALVRKVKQSDAITGLTDVSGFDYSTLYDTLAKRQYQYFINGTLAYYIPLGKKAVFKSAYNGGWVGVVTLELRLLLDQNSFFYLFSDNGYVVSDFNGFYKDDIYNGFGLGTTLETKSGLFSISYALGRNKANPIQFRQSKIHFGYLAYF